MRTRMCVAVVANPGPDDRNKTEVTCRRHRRQHNIRGGSRTHGCRRGLTVSRPPLKPVCATGAPTDGEEPGIKGEGENEEEEEVCTAKKKTEAMREPWKTSHAVGTWHGLFPYLPFFSSFNVASDLENKKLEIALKSIGAQAPVP